MELKEFSKKYRNKIIFNNVNISFEDNKIHYITGSNGAGKTTFFKCILNIEPYKGIVLFNNQNFQENKDLIEIIYDDSPLYTNLNGYKNIFLLCKNKIEKNEIDTYIRKFNLEEVLYTKVKKYSYGQRKKLSLIIGLLSKPEYLFLDEITNGLDYESMVFLKKLLKELTKTTTIIATGHNFEFYEDIFDEIYSIENMKMEKTKKENMFKN